MATKIATRSNDIEGESVLYQGANLSQLERLFKMDMRLIKERMHGIQPIGKRYNAAIYDVAEVAAKMGKLSVAQIDAAMRRMNHAELPKMVTKEYWNGLRAKQAYEIGEGDLWETKKVISEVGDMVKSLKMELDLLTDGVERSTELTERQREILVNLIDGTKSNMVKKLKERFIVQPARVVKDIEPMKPLPYDVSDL